MFNTSVLRISLLLCFLFVTACAPVAEPAPGADVATAEAVATEEVEEPQGTTVAIFVIDKFTTVTEIDEEIEADYPKGEGCIIDPDGSGYKSGGGGGSEHGRLVWSTITETLTKTYSADLVSGQSNADLWAFLASPAQVAAANAAGEFDATSQRWWIPGYGFIRLIPVDIGDFDTATVSAGIENTLATLELYGEEISRVVLNMSWVILPKGECARPADANTYRDLICELADVDDATREEFLDEIKETLDEQGLPAGSFEQVCEGTVFLNNVVKAAANPFLLRRRFALLAPEEYLGVGSKDPSGPLGQLLDRYAIGDKYAGQVISVGAAGNSGWEYPMMPALWDSVVSVSAWEGLGQNSADCDANSLFCSNSVEVTITGTHPYEGSLIADTALDCVPGFDCELYQNEVKGSSYAAPRLSVLAALYLLNGGTNPCSDQLGIHPPLGYMVETNTADTVGAWQNLEVATAAGQFCQAFPN